ncbi:disease resistance protein RPP2B-like [Pyrus x bretschneideri]|uniref:disease resistance protein RPP2B-like n=1 Tax=Pyrus x bretschneideri TaxID=225117 RepID=UPI00202EAA39|nr:disease resistance protein RPP2B-like [Pyrus x bretschneideri]
MQYSNLRQLCKRANFLPSLKILDVSHSHGLTEIIDFSLCPKLEELILVDCTSLIDVHESIGNLERLMYLNMKDCKNLRMLPKNMCMLKSLKTLILSGCSNLDEFPVEMRKEMESLDVLATDGIPLRLERSLTILSSFPCSLVELSLKGCNLSDDVFPTDLSNLSYLRSLHLDENPIHSLPVFIKGLRRLDHLSFRDCNRLESLVGLPKVHQMTTIEGCISLRKIKYLPNEQQSRINYVGGNDNLVEWENYYKIEPIDRVDVELIKLLGMCNLESMPAVRMRHPLANRNPKEIQPVQGLYQDGIFSTFFAGNEVPGRFSYKSTKSSISFIVPLLLASHRIRGLNIFATYARARNYNDISPINHQLLTKVSNKSKGLKWIYRPDFYGIPGEGEDMIWLSHWKMENETILQCGDQVVVSVVADVLIQIKEFGVELVQEHQNNIMISTQHNTKSDPNHPCVIGGDLSMREHIPGIYFLGHSKEYVEDTMKFPRGVLYRLIMDTDEEDIGMLCRCIAMNYTSSKHLQVHLYSIQV